MIPVPVPANTTPVLLLIQLPPGEASCNVVVKPLQTVWLPVITAGKGFTVITSMLKQPEGKVYLTVSVPLDIPVTSPLPEAIVATETVLPLHDPPEVALLSVAADPEQITLSPVIISGSGFTVTSRVV